MSWTLKKSAWVGLIWGIGVSVAVSIFWTLWNHFLPIPIMEKANLFVTFHLPFVMTPDRDCLFAFPIVFASSLLFGMLKVRAVEDMTGSMRWMFGLISGRTFNFVSGIGNGILSIGVNLFLLHRACASLFLISIFLSFVVCLFLQRAYPVWISMQSIIAKLSSCFVKPDV